MKRVIQSLNEYNSNKKRYSKHDEVYVRDEKLLITEGVVIRGSDGIPKVINGENLDHVDIRANSDGSHYIRLGNINNEIYLDSDNVYIEAAGSAIVLSDRDINVVTDSFTHNNKKVLTVDDIKDITETINKLKQAIIDLGGTIPK